MQRPTIDKLEYRELRDDDKMQAISQSTDQIWSGFRALGDPLRVQVIELLKAQELCVCELCDKLDVSQSKLSFHLKNLKEAGLLNARQQGRWIYYSLNLSQFAVLEAYLAEFQSNIVIASSSACDEVSPVSSCN